MEVLLVIYQVTEEPKGFSILVITQSMLAASASLVNTNHPLEISTTTKRRKTTY